MTHHYHQPEAFRYDERNFDTDIEPVIIDKDLSTFNADEKMRILRSYILKDATSFKTNRLLIPWGDDFWFSNAHVTYKNLADTMTYFNEKYDDITLLYSTPSEYIDMLKLEDVEWPVRYDDMMPYADQKEDFWTGYYTSRPGSKKLTRQASSFLHASTKIFADKMLQPTTSQD